MPTASLDFALLLDNLPAGVVVHALDTSIVYANPRALQLLGINWAQAIGKQAFDPQWYLLDETGRTLDIAEYPVNQVLRSGQGITEMVVGIRDFDHPMPTWVSVNAFLDRSQTTAHVVVTFNDISEYRRLPFREIVDKARDAVLVCKVPPLDLPDGPTIVYTNEAFSRLTGYSAAEVMGKTPRILQGAGTDRASLDRIRAALQAQQFVRETLLNYSKQGNPYWLDISIFPLHESGKEVTHYAAIQRDVTEAKLAELAHQDEAQRDPLTGLLNRRGFDVLAAGALQALRASGQGYAVIAVDLDYFKKVNDRFGHAVGDQVLCELAKLMQQVSRKDDLCARFGGEEFLLLLPSADRDEAYEVAERLRLQAAAVRIAVAEDWVGFTLSAGIAVDDGTQHLAETLANADQSLYCAKSLGRNRVQ